MTRAHSAELSFLSRNGQGPPSCCLLGGQRYLRWRLPTPGGASCLSGLSQALHALSFHPTISVRVSIRHGWCRAITGLGGQSSWEGLVCRPLSTVWGGYPESPQEHHRMPGLKGTGESHFIHPFRALIVPLLWGAGQAHAVVLPLGCIDKNQPTKQPQSKRACRLPWSLWPSSAPVDEAAESPHAFPAAPDAYLDRQVGVPEDLPGQNRL